MKFCDIMLRCGIMCLIDAICMAICIVVPGWVVCKVLFVVGVNCIAVAILTLD